MFEQYDPGLVIGIPDAACARPLRVLLEERRDVHVHSAPVQDLEGLLRSGRCACALLPPSTLLRDGGFMVMPGAGVVAREASLTERILSKQPLDSIRQIAVLPGAESLQPIVRILFAARGLPEPSFRSDLSNAEGAILVSGQDRGPHLESPDGYDIGSLWFELTGMPLVLGVWACAPHAPYRHLRQILGETARRAGEAIHEDGTGSPADARLRAHHYYHLLSHESDSLRMLMTLAARHLSGETIPESIVFC